MMEFILVTHPKFASPSLPSMAAITLLPLEVRIYTPKVVLRLGFGLCVMGSIPLFTVDVNISELGVSGAVNVAVFVVWLTVNPAVMTAASIVSSVDEHDTLHTGDAGPLARAIVTVVPGAAFSPFMDETPLRVHAGE